MRMRTITPLTAPAIRAVTIALALAALIVQPGPAHAQTGAPYEVIIGIDVSEGSPLVTDDVFATKAAKRIAERIDNLPMRSTVLFRMFGAHSTNDETLDFDRQISSRQPADQTAAFLRALIGGLPKVMRNGALEAHARSDIISFLNSMARSVDCTGKRTVLVLATDGFEDSEYANVVNGDSLPMPARPSFPGCARLELLGIGRGGGSPTLTERMIREWKDWGDAAGFTVTVPLDTW